MIAPRVRPLLVAAAAVGLVACADSISRLLDPSVNKVVVTNTPQEFRVQATELRNVNDKATYRWQNGAAQAEFLHRSFLHHGYGIVVVRDAVGKMVDSTLLEYDLDLQTDAGTPGNWTVELYLDGARGRIDFSLKPLAAPKR